MSDAGQPQREKAGCALGVAFGLLVLVGLVSTIVSQKTRLADGAELLAEWFELGTLPFGFEIEGATVEMRGEQVVLLTRADAPEEAPKAEPPKEERRDDDEDREEPDPVDWSTIPSGPANTPPFEVAVIRYPAGVAAPELARLFGLVPDDEGEVEITDVGPEGGTVVMDRGKLDWGPYTTSYVHERELEWGETFRDVVRVNLSLPKRATVLFVRWPRGFPGSGQRVVELLEALGPLPEELDEPEPAQ